MRLKIILMLSLFTANLSLLPAVTTNKSLASVKKTVKKKQSSPKQFYKLLPLAGITATITTFLCWLGLRNPNPKIKDTVPKEKKKVRFATGDPDVHVFEKDEPLVEKDEPLVEKDEPLVEKDEPLVEKDEPLVEKDEPLVEKDEPLVGKDEPPVKKQKTLPAKLQIIKKHQLNAFPDDQTYGSLIKFKKWIEEKKFDQMNGPTGSPHYDWWMFPTSDYGKNAPGEKGVFKVSKAEVEELKKNTEFMTNYREGVRLQMLSYGWDTETNSFITDRLSNQKYNNYHIRLEKLARSLGMFGEKNLHASVKTFAQQEKITHKKTCEYLDKMADY